MGRNVVVTYGNYTPVGDIIVLGVCITFAILIHAAYINRTRSFMIFRRMMIFLACAATADILYQTFLDQIGFMPNCMIYTMRVVYHACVFGHMMLYVIYMAETLHLGAKERPVYTVTSTVGYLLMIIYEIISIALGFGYRIESTEEIRSGFNVFAPGYLFFMSLMIILCVRYRKRVYRQVLIGILATCILSMTVLAIQGRHSQNSFTTVSYLFPAFALMYLMHSNPYDIDTGAINIGGFDDMIAYSFSKRKELLLMSLLVPEYDTGGKKYPPELQEAIRYASSYYFRRAVLFQVSGGRVILTAPTDKNPKYEETVNRILEYFEEKRAVFQKDFKIVISRTYGHISENNDYLGLIRYIEGKETINTVHRVDETDIDGYRKYRYIVGELADIHEKRDLADPRVEVFCQPVLNLRTGKYDTAEALMRLRLPRIGMVFPDQFIPIAEKMNYITVLSMIILSKTCMQIKALMEAGFFVRRISVNFSMIDLRNPDFSEQVNRIVHDSGIPFDKVAIELTESQNEKDFRLVKERINELKDSGMKFYLDDFGTGYSSFERIMELPFDIIKFDRSLVIASSSDIKSETMVSYLAHMFSDMNYAVLYEGVENDDDEERCGRMCAKYLQGYKYSKPIPIGQLTEFFDRSGEEAIDDTVIDVQELLEKYST